jgi:hypothetical protein
MLTLDASPRWNRWGAALLAVAVAGCGGKAGGNHAEAQGNEAGTAGTTIGGTGGGDDVGGSSASSGVGAAAGSIGVGGSSAEVGGSATGGSGGGLAEGLTQCPARGWSASVDVTDASGRTEQGTNGKVRVTVTKLEEQAPSELGAPPELKVRSYVLRGPTKDWGLRATIPGLTGDLIKEGDVLDFQLETSPGYIPFTRWTNQVFGLFAPEGELLLFGADTRGHDPVPDLSFLGLEVSDGGAACRTGADSVQACRYAAHTAHFSAPATELDLQPGESGTIGNLSVLVQTFSTILPSGGCDDSGRSIIVGAKAAAAQ